MPESRCVVDCGCDGRTHPHRGPLDPVQGGKGDPPRRPIPGRRPRRKRRPAEDRAHLEPKEDR